MPSAAVAVIATARDPDIAADALNDLPKGEGSKLIVARLDSEVDSDAATVVALLQKESNTTPQPTSSLPMPASPTMATLSPTPRRAFASTSIPRLSAHDPPSSRPPFAPSQQGWQLVDTADRPEFGGKFKSYDGTLLPW